MSFLKAEWRKLLMANYEVDPNILMKYVPFGTELDLWQGKCYVSLIGFMFMNTRLLGFKIPFHTNFEEVNLRFYVKRYDNDTWKRGVVFIKEIVPKSALTWVANTVYHENYETMPMRHNWEYLNDRQQIAYLWKLKDTWYSMSATSETKRAAMGAGSRAEFIAEHYWGYAKVDDKSTNEYEVKHPKWEMYNILDHEIKVDFKAVYGEAFDFLQTQDPDFVLLAEGSEITVEPKSKIKASE
jgi:uncharacterized protein YqjF (DUF2071 family)